MAIPIELVIMGAAFLLIIVGAVVDKLRIFKSLGGILLIIISVVILASPISNLDNLLNLALGSVCFGIGFVVWLTDSFSQGKQKERFDINEGQEEDGRFHDND